MIRRGGSNWTAVAIDEVLASFFTKSGRTAQLLENAQRSINSLLASFSLQLTQMLLGHGSPGGAHSGTQIPWLNLPREYRHEKRDQPPICLRKQLLRFGPDSVRSVRFANPRLESRLRHKSVAFQVGKVRSHGVISQMQFCRKFVHRPFSCSQEIEDFSPRAFEQALPPAYMFHRFKDHEDVK